MADDANTRMEQALAGLQSTANLFGSLAQVCQTAAESFTTLHQALTLTENPEDTVDEPLDYEDDFPDEWDEEDDFPDEWDEEDYDERGAPFWADK